jgi:hypothetical protein
MTGVVNSIALFPLSGCGEGQCGNSSARSSVKIDLRYVCSLVAAPLQVLTRIGFHSGSSASVIGAMSTASGLCLKPKTSPTVARIAPRVRADSSLRTARLVSKDIATVAQSIPRSLPLRGFVAVGSGRWPPFYSEVTA